MEAFAQDDPQKKIDGINTAVAGSKSAGLSDNIVKLKVAEAKSKGEILRAKNSIESIKPVLVAAITKNGKKEGYAVLDTATAQLVKDGVLTEQEAAEANKILGDWMDNYVAGRIESNKAAEKLTTRQTYQSLMPELLNPENATQRYDMVEQSKLSNNDKLKWQGYIKGSYQDAPTKNNPDGLFVSFNAVYDAATLENSPQESYDVLLEERFGKHNITNEQFLWAIDKIENPYPKPVLNALQATVKYNRSVAWWDDEKDKEVNEKIIGFVDDLIKRDKVPDFDLDKKLFAQSSKYRWAANSGYNIGDIITRGGFDWEIVGFDKTGEPVVERVP